MVANAIHCKSFKKSKLITIFMVQIYRQSNGYNHTLDPNYCMIRSVREGLILNIIRTIHQMFQLEEAIFVTELYRQVLNREPEIIELTSSTEMLRAGCSKLALVFRFLQSRELKRNYVRSRGVVPQNASMLISHRIFILLTVEATIFPQEMYAELLCREVEQSAWQHYFLLLQQGKSRMSIILGVLGSPECQNLLNSLQILESNELLEFGIFQFLEKGEAQLSIRPTKAPPLCRKVSIIILTWNGFEHTQQCMTSLAPLAEHELVDVVVLDNGSVDVTVPYMKTLKWVTLIENNQNIGFTLGNNLALAHCDVDSDIVLLNNDIIIEQEDWLVRLQETAYTALDIGIVGCRLRGMDGKLQHAGTYIFPDTCWGQQIGGSQIDIHQYGDVRDVQGVVFACAYIKRELIHVMGMLDTRYFAYFEDTDYCLRAIAAGYRVVYDGRITLIHVQNTTTKVNNVDFNQLFLQSQSVFREKWAHELERQYEHSLNWYSIVNLPGGYANSSRNIMIALDAQHIKMHYRYVYGPGTSFPLTEPEASDDYRINVFSMRRRHPFAPEVVYGQGDVFIKNEGKYKIGYTMLEVNGLPEEWVRQCNRMDEVWVPSTFNAETFYNSGVRTPIHIIPLGVDPNFFNPSIRSSRFSEKFTFLSVFEWGERKAPAEMLQTFANEFAHDDVLLVCKINNIDPAVNVRAEIRNLNLKHVKSKIIIIENQNLPVYMLGSLYRSVDCFVLPTRGEGWGMPILESMACGIPVIATDWSAQRDFLNAHTGFPIRVKRLVPAIAKCPYYTNFQWAEPDFEHLAHIMRGVYENQQSVKERSLTISQQILSQWTWENAVKKIAERIRQL